MLSSVLLWLQCQQVPRLSGLKCAYTISITTVAAGAPRATTGRESLSLKQM